MAFLKSHNHDIFVSYAHGPVPLAELGGGRIDPLVRWTRALVADLSEQVDFYLGIKDVDSRAQFWMDPELKGNLPLTADLRAKVDQSALMLLVMSPFYLQSDWCGEEVGWFTARRDRAGDVAGRLFLVRSVPTDEAAWPQALKDERGAALPGYRFHTAVRPGEMGDPYGWPVPKNSDREYHDLVGRLARDIVKQLQRLRWAESKAVEGAETSVVPKSVGRQVFLGYMHDTLSQGDEDVPTALRAAFGAAGLTVLPPAGAEPTDQASLRQALATYLPQSEAIVLVANQYISSWPAGQPGGFVSFQLDEARAKRVPAYLWLRIADLGRVRNDAYRSYLKELRVQADEKGLSLSHEDTDAFAASIVPRLFGTEIIQGQAQARRSSAFLNKVSETEIFLSYANEDQMRIVHLIRRLESEGWNVFWDRDVPYGRNWRQIISKALESASCVVVAWSSSSIGSNFVLEEADDAQARDVLVPVLLDNVKPPLGFRLSQAADFYTNSYRQQSLDNLVSEIRYRINQKKLS